MWVLWWPLNLNGSQIRPWDLRSVSTTRVHGPSSRGENSARELGCIFWHPSTWPEFTGVKKCTRVDGRQLGPWTRVHFWQPWTRAEFSVRELGPWTRVVETDLYTQRWPTRPITPANVTRPNPGPCLGVARHCARGPTLQQPIGAKGRMVYRAHVVTLYLYFNYRGWTHNSRWPLDRLLHFWPCAPELWPFDLIFTNGRDIVMDYPPAKFGDCTSSRFGFIVRRDRQNQRITQTWMIALCRVYTRIHVAG